MFEANGRGALLRYALLLLLPSSAPPAFAGGDFCPPLHPGANRPVAWKQLVSNTLCDQKAIWLYPFHFMEGDHAVAASAVAGATAGLILLDPTTARYFRRTPSFNTFNHVLSGNNAALSIGAAPLAFYGLSLLRKDKYGQQTSLFAGEALLDSELLATVIKTATRRLQPINIPLDGNFADSWLRSKGTWWRGEGCFPSGHEIAAFSVATVFAERYKKHRWVPFVAYGAATLIGLSRASLSAHYVSDVFFGAALGYSISRFTVLRQ